MSKVSKGGRIEKDMSLSDQLTVICCTERILSARTQEPAPKLYKVLSPKHSQVLISA